MAPVSKLVNKAKGKSARQPREKENALEPTLEELEAVLTEKTAEKRNVDEASSARAKISVELSSPVRKSSVISHPEALSPDLVQEMRSDINTLLRQRDQQALEINELKAKCHLKQSVDYQWRKDGNKKQYNIIRKLQIENEQARAIFAQYKNIQGNRHLENTANQLTERVKMLRIADSSIHGWATVMEYENNPVAESEEDDKKLRRAEQAAQAKIQLKANEKKTRQSRFSPYGGNFSNNNRNNEGNGDDKPEYSGYRAYGGYKNTHPYRYSSVAPDKQPPKRNINNDICYNCGARRNWANTCPEKKQQAEKPN